MPEASMTKYQHITGRRPCPYLPLVTEVIRPSAPRQIREAGSDEDYYLAALSCAQSLWLEGKPAQSLLQLNHALSIHLPPEASVLTDWPLPYQAKIWLFDNRSDAGFLGNPVRHYQHLATRVSGARRELRSWRAWACFHLATRSLPDQDFPRDFHQIESEELRLPTWDEVIEQLSLQGSHAEAQLLLKIGQFL